MAVIINNGDHTAHRLACEGLFKMFDAKTASISYMQDYAECVNYVYPKHDATMIKGVLVLFIVAIFVGAAVGAVKNDYDMSDRVMGGLMGAIISVLILAAIIGLVAAINFIVS